jgi:tetratricopeptide (TPR) repeat protein
MGSAVGAALYRWRRAGGGSSGREAVSAAAPESTQVDRARRGHRASVAPVEAPAETAAPLEAAGPPPAEVAHRAPRRPVPPPLLPPSEAETLASAFHELRSGGDATAALRSLDEYDRRFPGGALQGEARVARAEALLALDRRRDALPLLDGLEGAGGTPTRDVRVARGELLAEAGRCPDALRDFDAVLAASESDAAGGRALYGRASCRLRAGAVELARRDLKRYLSLHSTGPFATAARRAVGAPP